MRLLLSLVIEINGFLGVSSQLTTFTSLATLFSFSFSFIHFPVHATGLTKSDLNLPQVGISSVWYEGNPCNMRLNDLTAAVKSGVKHAGLIGMRFNTIGVSDGISMGTSGMSYSLQSRDLIADSIETVGSDLFCWVFVFSSLHVFFFLQVMGAQWYDANISLPGCDKNMPGCLIAMGRLNRSSSTSLFFPFEISVCRLARP
jgi:dihydroxy-acid dehydratase